MDQVKRQTTKANPFTAAVIVGLGWGLVLGFVDGIPVLSELPIPPYLRVQLQALLYMMMWYGLVGMALLGTLGLVVWGLLRILQRDLGRRKLIAVYSGVCIGLANFITGLHGTKTQLDQFADPDHAMGILLLVVLGSIIGAAVSMGVYGAINWWQNNGRGFLRPLHWKPVRTGLLTFFLIGVLALSAVAFYRGYARYWAILRPKSEHAATAEQPNVVLITIDTLRADHLGLYGYDPEISPNIDALAEQGIVFDQAIAQAPWTVPSVGSFITSLYPTELDILNDLTVDEMRVTMAEMLQNKGYRTYGYISNPLVVSAHQFNQGFDQFVHTRVQRSFDLEALRQRPLFWLLCRNAPAVCKAFDQGHRQLFDPRITSQGDQWITQYGTHFLKRHRDERFFLWLYYMGPHTPYDPPKPFRPLSDDISPQREQELRYPDSWLHDNRRTVNPKDHQMLVSLYDGEIAYTDKLIGQVVDELNRLNLLDRTIIILVSDHGEEFADHGRYGHSHTLYDELVHVPFIITGPGVEATGRRVETQVRLLDLLPTVCDMLGAPVPEEAEGRSLMPFLQGEDMEELPAFAERRALKATRYEGHKLVYHSTMKTLELYDLQADPHEQVNLADQEPEIVEEMLAEIQAWMIQSEQVAAEFERQRPSSETMDDETLRRLRDAGY